MNKSILITGAAGSGKSAVCDELNKLGYKAFGIEDIDGLFAMVDRKTGKPVKNFDIDNLESVKQADWICDKSKLQQLVRKNSNGVVFYCGTASNLNDLLPLFDKIFLLKVSQKVLRERLSTRTSNNFGRTAEVQKWVFSRKKWWEDHMKEQGAIVIDASRSCTQRLEIEPFDARKLSHLSKESGRLGITLNYWRKDAKDETSACN